jgi:hypothetical protein
MTISQFCKLKFCRCWRVSSLLATVRRPHPAGRRSRFGLARRTVRQRMAHNRPSSLALLKASSMAAKASACRVLFSYGPTFSCSKTDLVDSFTV